MTVGNLDLQLQIEAFREVANKCRARGDELGELKAVQQMAALAGQRDPEFLRRLDALRLERCRAA